MPTAKRKKTATVETVVVNEAASKPPYRGLLAMGDYHDNVAWAKSRLNAGEGKSFDRRLRDAVAAFQQQQGWRVTGRLDKAVWGAL